MYSAYSNIYLFEYITTHFEQISPQEAVACANLLKHPSEAFGLGVTVAGTKYLVTRASDEVIAARKGSNGLFLYKSNKAIVLALHDETMNAGTCSTYAGKACDYFKGLGF